MIIYKITNTINNKIYIGQTISKLSRRLSGHRQDCKTKDTLFYRAVRKYGFGKFKIEQIDSATTRSELNNKERYWISYYKSFDEKYGYNLTAGGVDYQDINEEVRKKIGNSSSLRNRGSGNPRYGKKCSKKTKRLILKAFAKAGMLKPIYCYDLQGKFIKKFKSKRQAARELNLDRKSMNCVLKGENTHHKGYKFSYNESKSNKDS